MKNSLPIIKKRVVHGLGEYKSDPSQSFMTSIFDTCTMSDLKKQTKPIFLRDR